MPTPTCPSSERLRSYGIGDLSESESSGISSHLAECHACTESLSQFDDDRDLMLEYLRRPLADPPPLDPVFAQVARRLKQLPMTEGRWPEAITELGRLGQYDLLEPIGEGGMGQVWRARHRQLKRDVAIKMLPRERLHQPVARARFEREMEIVGRMEHPAIVRALDAGEIDDRPFLVMEYVDGADLSRLLKCTGPLRVADACEIICQAARGLQHALDHGMVHRDIKPSNLMLASLGHVKILDLGLALLHDQVDQSELTASGQLLGTLDYMAPEQCESSREVDIRADIYGLGATLYKLLTGQPPFGASESPLRKLKQIAQDPVPPIQSLRPDLPLPLARAVERMLAKEPSERFAEPQEVVEVLETWTNGADLKRVFQQAESGSSTIKEPAPQPSRTRRRWPKLIAVALLLLAIGAAAYGVHLITNTGELIIRTERPGVEVIVKRSDGAVRLLEIDSNAERTRLRKGEYEIFLLGEADGLRIQQNRVELTRGGQVVVTIEERPVGAAEVLEEPKTVDAPSYAGKTFEQWLEIMQTERQPELLTTAVRGLVKLSNGRDQLAARTIFDVMQHYDSKILNINELESQFIEAAIAAYHQLESDAARQVLVERLKEGGTNQRRFALWVLSRASTHRSRIDPQSEAVGEALTAMVEDEQAPADLREWARSVAKKPDPAREAELPQSFGPVTPEGRWRLVSAYDSGRHYKQDMELIVDEQKMTFREEGEPERVYLYKILHEVPGYANTAIDLRPLAEERVIKGIFMVQGNRLSLVLNEQPDGARPTEFTSEREGPNDVWLILERVPEGESLRDSQPGDTTLEPRRGSATGEAPAIVEDEAGETPAEP